MLYVFSFLLGVYVKTSNLIESIPGPFIFTLLSVLFGNYGLIADLLDTDHKMQLYCFVARFLFILEKFYSSRT